METAVKCKLSLYADDSTLIVSGKNIKDIETELSDELQSANNWLVDNMLSLHTGKSEAILFGTKNKIRDVELAVTCNGETIEFKKQIKYLGQSLDQTLSGKEAVKNVLHKCNNRLKFMYRNSHCLNQNTKKLLCNALIQCHIDYASSTWYSSLTKADKKKLQVCQNKMVRYVLNLKPRDHVGYQELHKLNWLNVETRMVQLKLQHVYRISKNLAPDYLNDLLSEYRNTHMRVTRNCSQYRMPSFKTKMGLSSFTYLGIKHWNLLPTHLRLSATYSLFKAGLKKFLKSQQEETETREFVFY